MMDRRRFFVIQLCGSREIELYQIESEVRQSGIFTK